MTIAAIIKESFSLKETEQKNEIVLNTLDEWDSMAHMLFITKLEENLNIEFSGDEILTMQTIGDIKKILALKGVQV